MDCVAFDMKHYHAKVQIKDELETRNKEWKLLIESIESLKEITEVNYYQHEHLIKYLDNENLIKTDL
jgi:predicted SprT family Zn-dependent metalloprotease